MYIGLTFTAFMTERVGGLFLDNYNRLHNSQTVLPLNTIEGKNV